MKKTIVYIAVFICFFQISQVHAVSKTSYSLSWPGILPDHPFYIIKKIRDKLAFNLITTPQKKLFFYILQADKGMYATLLLASKGKIALAKETGLKAEHNYTLAVTEYTNMVYSGQKIPETMRYAMLRAPLKHQEILQISIEKMQKEDVGTFLQIIEFSKRNLELTQRVAIDELKRNN